MKELAAFAGGSAARTDESQRVTSASSPALLTVDLVADPERGCGGVAAAHPRTATTPHIT